MLFRSHRHQTYEPVPIGFDIGSRTSCDEETCTSPVWAVLHDAWQKAGGRTVGTTGTDNVTLGELRLGKGAIRIVGALLPFPSHKYYHPFGLSDYALTYTGYQVFKNVLQWQRTNRRCPGGANLPGLHVVGTPRADTLVGTNRAEVICGLGRDDTLKGLGGADVLLGGEGGDQLRGGTRDDHLVGGIGSDSLGGGGGADVMLAARGSDTLNGAGGADRMRGGAGEDTLAGESGDDVLVGGRGADTFRGGPGGDRLNGVDGRSGNDFLDGGGDRDDCRADRHDTIRDCP